MSDPEKEAKEMVHLWIQLVNLERGIVNDILAPKMPSVLKTDPDAEKIKEQFEKAVQEFMGPIAARLPVVRALIKTIEPTFLKQGGPENGKG